MPLLKHRCGYRPSPNPSPLRFGAYVNAAALPATPQIFGHYSLIGAKAWGELDNNRIGNCTIVGPMHCVMLWNAIAGQHIKFTALDADGDYAAVSGWNGSLATDIGCDPTTVAEYWRTIGVRDCTDTRHKIASYFSISPTNIEHIYAAAYLFDAVGLCVNMPSSAEGQFDAGEPWTVVAGDTIEDGHYVPLVGRDASYSKIVTWGALQDVTEEWLSKYLIEVVGIVSPEYLVNNKSPLGFDLGALMADQEALS